MLTLYPAIDIRNGRCVRLLHGKSDAETVYFEDPLDAARLWIQGGAPWLHVVDLDGAFTGQPANLAVVGKIAALGVPVQLGGGLRDAATVEKALAAGVARVVIGTSAVEDPALLEDLLSRFGPEKIAVGLDAKDGKLAVRGWVENTDVATLDFARRLEQRGVRHVIHTDIATDGALVGPNLAQQKELATGTNLQIIASGGISSLDDIRALNDIARSIPNLDGVIVGKALYEKRVTVEEMVAITG